MSQERPQIVLDFFEKVKLGFSNIVSWEHLMDGSMTSPNPTHTLSVSIACRVEKLFIDGGVVTAL